jgi:hypothetical protein
MYSLKRSQLVSKSLVFASATMALIAMLNGCGSDTPDIAVPEMSLEVISSSSPSLVSGGDALLKLKSELPAGTSLKVSLNNVDISAVFKKDPEDGKQIGLVSGLVTGNNSVLASVIQDNNSKLLKSTTLTVTNYPITGPMISGPHQSPYICTTNKYLLPDGTNLGNPLDANCSVARRVHYVYKTTDTKIFAPLADPTARPANLASVTNNIGKTVKYIVRVETGTINRAIYQTAILHDPVVDAVPSPTSPPAGWNKKVIYPLGGGCQAGWYTQGTSTVPTLDDGFLTAGYGVLTATLNTFGTNCNDLLSSETILMVKERFIESYGVPKFTIGTGSSGGSYQSNQTVENYPGTFDGIVTTNSFPDVTTGLVSLGDTRLLDIFFNTTRPGAYTEAQQKAISGFLQVKNIAFLSGRTGTAGSAQRMDPRDQFPSEVPVGLRYNPVSNPTGARGSVYDHTVNVYGRIAGTPGAGFAQRPLDNVGVQYGLKALNDGVITFAQFLELNTKIGGFDIDLNQIPTRTEGYPDAIRRAYQGGRIISGANGLASTPIITRMSAGDTAVDGNIHLRFWSHAIRARLMKANGNVDNHVIVGDLAPTPLLIEQMDRWLTTLVADTSTSTKAQKVVKSKPADAVDACWTASGEKIVETQTLTGTGKCNALFPVGLSSYLVAGAPIALDVIKCQLKPITAADYKVALSTAELAQLNAAFPKGVCDWSKPGVEQVKGVTWASFGPSPVNQIFDVTKP